MVPPPGPIKIPKPPWDRLPYDIDPKTGLQRGTWAKDIVPNDQAPPTLSLQSNIANQKVDTLGGGFIGGRIGGKVKPNPKFKMPKNPRHTPYSALGAPGYTPASNYDNTSISGKFTGTNNSGGGGLAISPTGQYQQFAKPKAKIDIKRTTSKPKWQDSEYLSEIRALERALADFRAKQGIDRTRAGTQYSLSRRDLKQTRGRDLENIAEDFAARGIVRSGVYGGKVGEYNQLSNQQMSELERQYKNSLTDVKGKSRDYLREVQSQREQARLAAIRRRAQKLGKL